MFERMDFFYSAVTERSVLWEEINLFSSAENIDNGNT